MPTKSTIQFSVVAGVLITFIFLSFDNSVFDAVTRSASIVFVFLVIYDRWFWRKFFIPQLTKTPVLHGTWKGSYASNYENPETRKNASGDIYLVVKQTFWSVSVRSLSEESSSRSITATLRKLHDSTRELVYVYSNKPKAAFKNRSKPNTGTAFIDVGSKVYPQLLKGSYFTDRGHEGDLVFEKHQNKIADSYEEAEELF